MGKLFYKFAYFICISTTYISKWLHDNSNSDNSNSDNSNSYEIFQGAISQNII